jgi:uncharacterized membrane protein
MATSDNPRSLTQRYLDELSRRLNRLPEPERREAVREIASHVAEATANGRPTAAILAQLGSPEALARAYAGDYFLQRRAAGFIGKAARLLMVAAVALGSGFATLVVVPTLALTSIGFGVAAVLSPVLGVLRSLGASWIVIGMSDGWQVPLEWSVPVTVAIAVVCGTVAWGAAWLLRIYLRTLLRGVRRVLPVNI